VSVAGRRGLSSSIVAVPRLDDATRQEMWELFSSYYCESSYETFVEDLEHKDHVIVLRSRADGSLGGFSTLQCYKTELHGRRAVVVFSGDTLVAIQHWGQTALQNAFFRYIIWAKLSHPLCPVYWFLITKGYKTYLLLSRNFPVYWPRHERSTPAWESALLDTLATEKFGDRWVPERGVLKHMEDSGRLREGVAPVDEEISALRPDIHYFVTKNPGHAEGDELCCIGLVNPTMWANWLRRLTHKKLRRAGSMLGLLEAGR